MKPIITILVLASLAGCKNFSQPQEKTGLEGKPLPAFNLFLADSATHFNTANIPEGQPIALFYFGPYCPYSRAEMDDILSNMKTYSNIRFYLITGSPFSDMKVFYDHYNLKQYKNIVTGIDTSYFFANYFNANLVPYMAIYDKEKKLNRVLVGKTDISALKDIASK